MRPQPPGAEQILDEALKETRILNKRLEIRPWPEDAKYVKVARSGVYDASTGRTYQQNEAFLCRNSTWVQAWWDKGEVQVLSGGAVFHGHVYEGETYLGPLIVPWNVPHPEHPELGPVRLLDSDLFAQVRLRGRPGWGLRTLLDLCDPSIQPGYCFWTSWAVLWHRVPGRFVICDEQGAVRWGVEDALLELLRPA